MTSTVDAPFLQDIRVSERSEGNCWHTVVGAALPSTVGPTVGTSEWVLVGAEVVGSLDGAPEGMFVSMEGDDE